MPSSLAIFLSDICASFSIALNLFLNSLLKPHTQRLTRCNSRHTGLMKHIGVDADAFDGFDALSSNHGLTVVHIIHFVKVIRAHPKCDTRYYYYGGCRKFVVGETFRSPLGLLIIRRILPPMRLNFEHRKEKCTCVALKELGVEVLW